MYGLDDNAEIVECGIRCNVTFDANGGTLSGSDTAVAVSGLNFGITQTAVRDGYTFDGWFTAADGGVQVCDNDMWKLTEDTVLYAHWTVSASSTVTFDANGGDLVGDATVVVQYGSKLDYKQTATRTGYTFDGWFTDPDGGEKIEKGTVWEITVDVTLYAHWTAKTYTVTFDVGNGTGGTIIGPTEVNVTFGEAFVFSQTASWSNHDFLGWNTQKDGSGTMISSGYVWDIDGDTVLYALWSQDEPRNA